MPELPEVETTLRGIMPHVEGRRIEEIVVRQPQLRWPVPKSIRQAIGRRVNVVRRRAKYLLLETLQIHMALTNYALKPSLKV